MSMTSRRRVSTDWLHRLAPGMSVRRLPEQGSDVASQLLVKSTYVGRLFGQSGIPPKGNRRGWDGCSPLPSGRARDCRPEADKLSRIPFCPTSTLYCPFARNDSAICHRLTSRCGADDVARVIQDAAD